MFTAINPILTVISRDHNKKLVKIIQTLLAYEQSNIFRKPIPHKALGWNNYKQIVKKPVDLNLVRRNYNEGKYKSVEEVLDDIQVVWDNAFSYGRKDHQSFDMAFKMQKYFDDLIREFYPQYYQKINRVLYFKQFETQNKETKKQPNLAPLIPQKSGQQKRNQKTIKVEKMEKMDLQNVKQQIQKKEEVQTLSSTLSNKKKESANTKSSKPIITVSSLPTNVVTQPVVQQTSKKPIEIVHKPIISQPPKVLPPIQMEKEQKVEPFVSQSQIQSAGDVPMQIDSEPQFQPNPIFVNLKQSPSIDQLNNLTQIMSKLYEQRQFQLLQKVVKILTKYQKQNMIIDGEDVNFKMNQIHISTYFRIRKQLQGFMNRLQDSKPQFLQLDSIVMNGKY